jgi:hypothetical protein
VRRQDNADNGELTNAEGQGRRGRGSGRVALEGVQAPMVCRAKAGEKVGRKQRGSTRPEAETNGSKCGSRVMMSAWDSPVAPVPVGPFTRS